MGRASLALLLAFGVVVGARVGAREDDGYPLVLVPQGISLLPVPGGRVLVRREGTLTVEAFAPRSPGGRRVRWCPHEELFWDGETLFDRQGRYVFGPAPRDLDRLRMTVDADQLVDVEPGAVVRSEGRSDGTIAGEVFEFYQRYLNQTQNPFSRTPGRILVFCPNPLA